MLKINLFKILCDGEFHSGTNLGEQLHCSRSAIWKAIKGLKEEFNVTIFSVRGRGYCLNSPVELLNSEQIHTQLSENSRNVINKIELFFNIDSTNEYLISETKLNKYNHTGCRVCFAEYQYNGKGRRGKQWVSPMGGNLYCSISWHFNKSFQEIAGLSLAVSVGITMLLDELGVKELELKWPNDVLWQGKKLVGVLLEMHGESSGPCTTVIGIGVNYNMSKSNVDIDQPWCDLNSILKTLPARNNFAAKLIDKLITTIQLFDDKGLDAFLELWRSYDVLQNKSIMIKKLDSIEHGIARGIDHSGALLVEQSGVVSALYSGDVSIRLN